MIFIRLLILTLLLYVLRFFPGGYIEAATIMEPMHAPMATQADCFGFRPEDFNTSLVFNFVMWLTTVILFHIGHPQIKGSMLAKSLIVFGLACLFFCSLAAIYMNHFNMEIRQFFRYSMLDALLLFTFLGIINSILYPIIVKRANKDKISG